MEPRPSYEARAAACRADPGTSYALRAALAELERLDPIDAANGASLLAELMQQRVAEATARAVHAASAEPRS